LIFQFNLNNFIPQTSAATSTFLWGGGLKGKIFFWGGLTIKGKNFDFLTPIAENIDFASKRKFSFFPPPLGGGGHRDAPYLRHCPKQSILKNI
jgi:hypothetical protein